MSSYERRGADGTTVYCCPVCLRIELNSYEGWLWHLGSSEHQMKHVKCDQAGSYSSPFFNPRGPERHAILRRCIDVHGILGLKARQLLDYFKTWGEIEDFSYWYKKGTDGTAVRCVCLYKDKEATDACISEPEHKLDGKVLKVEPYKQGGGGGDREYEKRDDGYKKRKSDDRTSYGDFKRKKSW